MSNEAQLKADYADLGVSCGYIGNIYCGPVRDDRSFRVFTQVEVRRVVRLGDIVVTDRFERVTVPVFDVPAGHQGVWEDKVAFDTPEVRARLDELRAQVAAGTARVMGGA